MRCIGMDLTQEELVTRTEISLATMRCFEKRGGGTISNVLVLPDCDRTPMFA